jgi:hypothetical protein
MTAMTVGADTGIERRRAPAAGFRRVLNVARLQTVAWRAGQIWPWIIMLIAFGVNLALFTALDRQGVEEKTTGGLSSIYFVLCVTYFQAVTKDFSFALSMGVTRRTFCLGLTLFAVVQAILYGSVLGLFRLAEVATDGWGIGLAFFAPDLLQVDNPFLQWLIYVVPFLFVAAVGAGLGTIVKRWGVTGVMVLTAVAVALSGGLITLATGMRWWDSIGSFFSDSSTVALWAGWPALIAVLMGLAVYLGLRRAVP